jgi:two-component sensor histidine kinase
MTALEKRITSHAAYHQRIYDSDGSENDRVHASDLFSLLAAHAKCKRELALIRKLARMSGVDKHWWKVGGVTL